MTKDLVLILKWVKILLDACSIYSVSLHYTDLNVTYISTYSIRRN